MTAAHPGHSVLQLPVPPLEDWVRARTRHHDPTFVSRDADFGHAHITVLAPFVPDPGAEDLARVDQIAAAGAPVEVHLSEVATFPDGIIHLRVQPEGPVRELTRAVRRAFPALLPYEGRFGPEPVPHLTLDAVTDEVSEASTRRLLGELLPVTCELDRLHLAWWQAGDCHVMHRWRLEGTRPRRPLPRGEIIL